MPGPVAPVRLILGSASPARLRVLRAAGVSPRVVVSDVDEDAVVAALPDGTDAPTTVQALARAKAEEVARRVRQDGTDLDTVVVGCDSMLLFDGALLGKPHTPDRAREQWRRMRGRRAELLTGHHLIRDAGPDATSRTAGGVGRTTVSFAPVDDATIDAYVATGEPLHVAGAFTLDGLGGWFVDGVGGDPSSVIGISLPLVRRLLADVGVAVPDLWAGSAV
ncbi:Maf family protein [Williamsia sterculiae]|uniref:Nucleoside triphosphate pyrophosphatase n=1 Tax=Williamsia sterculiae TaxID=1344003 RepID=A0A1N7DZQ6_9NOCA|nr:nucleoside triphosphate pyrophosphatase [Williamsia sterculiae]SIR81310.1 septum formation protein [Williamsia sterculiae]